MDKEQLQALQDEVNKTKDLASLAASEGGRMLIKAQTKDILTIVKILSGGYKTLPEMELRSWCASLSEKLTMLDVLNGAPGDYAQASEDLKEALKPRE